MLILIAGLIIFLGLHSSRIFAEGPRQRFIAQRGEKAWKGLYSLGSLLGFALIIWGYSLARQQPVTLWNPPVATRHIAALLTLIAFILVFSANGKNNFFRAKLHHPMVLGVKVWAISHLISNGNLADLLLFGGFLVWAVLCFSSSRKRDRNMKIQYPASEIGPTLIAVATGVFAWAVMAFWLHGALIGVKPFG
jgi:uncharacterized membrane protein